MSAMCREPVLRYVARRRCFLTPAGGRKTGERHEFLAIFLSKAYLGRHLRKFR